MNLNRRRGRQLLAASLATPGLEPLGAAGGFLPGAVGMAAS